MGESCTTDNSEQRVSSRVVTIVNHADSLNLGDASQLCVEIQLIENTLHPQEIFILSFDLEKETNMRRLINNEKVTFVQSPGRTCYGRNKRILAEMILFFMRLSIIRLLGREPRAITGNNRVYNILRRSDLVISKGADNLSDSYGLFSLIVQLYNIILPLFLNKKVVILGTSVGPFRNRLLRKLTCYYLRKTYVVARDMKSLNILRNEGMDENRLRFIPDLAFDLPIVSDAKYDMIFRSSGTKYLGIGISALIHKYVKKSKPEFAAIVAEHCDHFISKYNAKIILIPHVLSYYNDVDMANEIYSRVKEKDKVVVIHESNPMKIKYLISKLDLLISFRMHPLVHALSLGVPVIGIDYNDKTRELLKLFKKEKWVLPIMELSGLESLVEKYLFLKKDIGDFVKVDMMNVSNSYSQVLRKLCNVGGRSEFE